MADDSQHDFVNKAITLSLWGMDAALKPFTETAKTRQLAERAAELDFKRQLALGEVIGVGYRGKKSRFRVIQSFLASEHAYRITLEDTGNGDCMWTAEMAEPDVIVPRGERRRESRLTVVGSAQLFNADGASSSAKVTDVSRGGCYVETFAPSPVGTEMALVISLEGVQAELRAVVRTSHSSIGMGMEILGFSDDVSRERFLAVVDGLQRQQSA